MTALLQSFDPASGELVWEGEVARPKDCHDAVAKARLALPAWRSLQVEDRIAVARRYADILQDRRRSLAELISRETGKLLWESDAEVGSMIAKVDISIKAHAERTGERQCDMAFGRAVLRHRAHGVMAVLGPYNFPGHLPNGHIVPALMAGNVVIFKPSEIAPATGAAMAEAWFAAGLPPHALQVVQGGRATGEALVAADIDGLLFTGSAGAGSALRRALLDRPHVIMALELGGNNPLIAWDSPEAAASIIVNSAFITTGQRCSCARRLIVPEGAIGDAIVEAAAAMAARLPVAAWTDPGEAFLGPLVSEQAASAAHAAVDNLLARGARTIQSLSAIEGRSSAFVTPAMFDVTGVEVPDAEIFAPVLSVIRVPDFDAAIQAANATAFGLSAGLISQDQHLWSRMVEKSRAGVVNRNRPTTGAAGNMPFGGLGASGNHRPSAYYAADYCAYPIASFEAESVDAVPVNGLNIMTA
jgi:succinylglutamic semialdehyde dehydrogenase